MRAQLRVIPSYQPTREDIAREKRMTAILDGLKDLTRAGKKKAWAEYRELHNQRPEGFVRHMEHMRGLR